MMKLYRILDGRLSDAGAGDCSVSLYVNPDESERRVLVNEHRIDEHTLTSALDPDELSRLEFEPEHAALIINRPRNYSSVDEFNFRVSSMGLFLFRDRMVIVAQEELMPLETHPVQRVTSLPELLLKILYRTTLHYLEHLKIMNMIADALEAKIQRSMENRHLINLFTLEKSLVYYQNSIHSNGVAIERLKTNAARIGFTPENLEFLDDLIIENTQCYRQAEIYSNIFASLMDARVSVVNNNLSVLMKNLNIITISIMVPTFVVSVFSMNVGIPLADRLWAFWAILGVAVVASGVMALVWRARGRSAEPRRRRRRGRLPGAPGTGAGKPTPPPSIRVAPASWPRGASPYSSRMNRSTE
jgi:magnesium transporter